MREIKFVFSLLSIVFIGFLLFYFLNKKSEDNTTKRQVGVYLKKIDSLTKIIEIEKAQRDSLINKIHELDSTLSNVQNNIVTIKEVITITDSSIYNLNKRLLQIEKDTAVKKLTKWQVQKYLRDFIYEKH